MEGSTLIGIPAHLVLSSASAIIGNKIDWRLLFYCNCLLIDWTEEKLIKSAPTGLSLLYKEWTSLYPNICRSIILLIWTLVTQSALFSELILTIFKASNLQCFNILTPKVATIWNWLPAYLILCNISFHCFGEFRSLQSPFQVVYKVIFDQLRAPTIVNMWIKESKNGSTSTSNSSFGFNQSSYLIYPMPLVLHIVTSGFYDTLFELQ